MTTINVFDNPDAVELSRTDCEALAESIMRGWRAGQTADANKVFRDFPEICNYRTIAIDLAYEEYCVSKEAGRSISQQEFCSRFPDIRRSLEQQIDLHNLLDDSPDLLEKCVGAYWPTEGEVLQGFEICDEVGRGAFSRVYRARELAVGNRHVIVKASTTFGADEAQILGRLDHPNIVPIFSTKQEDSRRLSLICMPDLGEATLVDFIKAVHTRDIELAFELVAHTARLPLSDVNVQLSLRKIILNLTSDLADALEHAHSQGILHLDIKPSNILLCRSGSPMLLDFNLSLDQSEEQKKAGGTLPYMSPEELTYILGKTHTRPSVQSDIFSLGVVLFELLLHRLPFEPASKNLMSQETASDMLERQAIGFRLGPTEVALIGRDLCNLLTRCLAFEPTDRFPRASDLSSALRAVLSNDSRRGRRRVLHCAAVTMAAAVGGFGAIAFASTRSTRSLSLRRAEWQLQKGAYLSAVDELRELVRTDPSATNLAMLGYASTMARDHNGACHWYIAALQRGPECAKVLNNLGYSYYRQGQQELSVQALRRATELDPTMQAAFHNRALVEFALVEGDGLVPLEAMADIERAIQLGEGSQELFRDAARIFARAAEVDPNYIGAARYHLLRALEAGVDRRDLAQSSRIRGVLGDLDSDSKKADSRRANLPARARLVIAPPFDLKS